MCVCVSLPIYNVLRHSGTKGSRKRASDLLDLELLAVVSYSVWALGTELESSENSITEPSLEPYYRGPKPPASAVPYKNGFRKHQHLKG